MRLMMNGVIHLEGMDLAGKSTAAVALAKRVGAQVRHNALLVDNPAYRAADELRRHEKADPTTLGHLYLDALVQDLRGVRSSNGLLVQDSTILLRSAAVLHRPRSR